MLTLLGLITSIHSRKNEKFWLLNFGVWRRSMTAYQARYLWVLMCTYGSITSQMYLNISI